MRPHWSSPAPETSPGFTDFVAARLGPLTGLARGLVRSDADAEDLVQDTLAKALLNWGRVSSAHDPAAYVNRMLVNAATSRWRRASRREAPTSTGELPEVVGADDAQTLHERDALLRALRTLPVRHRAVLVLRYYEQLPDVEIAELLGVAQATVRSSAARGLAGLRRAGVLTDSVGSRV